MSRRGATCDGEESLVGEGMVDVVSEGGGMIEALGFEGARRRDSHVWRSS